MRAYPKRFRLIVLLSSFLGGSAIGAIYFTYVSEYIVSLSLVLFAGFFIFRRYGVSLVLGAIAMLGLGYWWSGIHAKELVLAQPFQYQGEAIILSSKLTASSRTRVLFQLNDGEKAGLRADAYAYDWGYSDGSTVTIRGTVQPSDFIGHKAKAVIGTFDSVAVEHVVASPSGLYAFRERLQQRVGASLPEPYASLAIGLVTGANDDFDIHFREDLERTGTSHIVAVSGANLTIVALLLMRLGRRKSRWFGFWLAIGGILAYIVLAGASAAVVRGGIMSFLILSASMAGRITHRLPLLLISGAILGALFPLGMIYSLSWQLSFLAFAGILFIGPCIGPYFRKLGILGQSLGETLAAELMVLPLILFQFGVISIVSPFVNALVLGLTPFAMAISFLEAVVAFLSVDLGRWFAWISYPVLYFIVKPIQWASTLSFAAYNVDHYPVPYFVLTYVILGVGIYFLLRTTKTPHEK